MTAQKIAISCYRIVAVVRKIDPLPLGEGLQGVRPDRNFVSAYDTEENTGCGRAIHDSPECLVARSRRTDQRRAAATAEAPTHGVDRQPANRPSAGNHSLPNQASTRSGPRSSGSGDGACDSCPEEQSGAGG